MDQALDDIARQLDAFLRPDEDEKQARKRERILRAATECFISHGYRKASMEDIARAAGVAKGTVYLYYGTKAELLFHAIALEKQRYLTRLAPLRDPGLNPRDRLRGFIFLGLVLSRNMPLATRMTGGDREILLAIQEVDADVLEYINRQQIGMTAQLIGAAAGRSWPRDELNKRAQVLIDLMFAVMTSSRMIQHSLPPEEYAQLLAGMVVDGVVNGPAVQAPLVADMLAASGEWSDEPAEGDRQ